MTSPPKNAAIAAVGTGFSRAFSRTATAADWAPSGLDSRARPTSSVRFAPTVCRTRVAFCFARVLTSVDEGAALQSGEILVTTVTNIGWTPLFPRAAAYERPEYWACLLPMTPDGPPIMGPCGIANLWLNTGHGYIGWTMACGSGKFVADLVSGRKPEIDTDGLLYVN